MIAMVYRTPLTGRAALHHCSPGDPCKQPHHMLHHTLHHTLHLVLHPHSAVVLHPIRKQLLASIVLRAASRMGVEVELESYPR